MSSVMFFAVTWYATGIAGFLWWWTQDEPLDRNALAEAALAGVLGPVTLLLGLCVHRLMAPGETDADDVAPPAAEAGEAPSPLPSIHLQTGNANHVHPITGSSDDRPDRR